MNIIKLTEVDKLSIAKLANLASEIWYEYRVKILSKEQIDYMVELFQSEKAICNQIENENYTYFFIKNDNSIAGYVGLSEKEDYLFLSKLYIKKEFRNKGLGRKVFELVKEFAKTKSYKLIRLTVNKYNINTINAYVKWGFKIIDSAVADIGSNFVMDDYIMEYKL